MPGESRDSVAFQYIRRARLTTSCIADQRTVAQVMSKSVRSTLRPIARSSSAICSALSAGRSRRTAAEKRAGKVPSVPLDQLFGKPVQLRSAQPLRIVAVREPRRTVGPAERFVIAGDLWEVILEGALPLVVGQFRPDLAPSLGVV